MSFINKNYNQEFGPGGAYTWPSDQSVAMAFIEAVPWAKSSSDCLNEYFFYEILGYKQNLDQFLDSDNEDQDQALEEAEAYTQQQMFQHARSWPLPYLVTSAVYEILSKDARMHPYDWSRFFWVFLLFDEPLFGMLQEKGWDKMYQNSIREGFKSKLKFETKGLTNRVLIWGNDGNKPWFTCRNFPSHICPENVLRCLDLIGIDQNFAQSAVDQVFKLQSLTPFYDVLLD
jgi:hypothetical protein